MFLRGWRRELIKGLMAKASKVRRTSSTNSLPSPSRRVSYQAAASVTSSPASGRTTTRQLMISSGGAGAFSFRPAARTTSERRGGPPAGLRRALHLFPTMADRPVRARDGSEAGVVRTSAWEVLRALAQNSWRNFTLDERAFQRH